jgi:hypothetical protein
MTKQESTPVTATIESILRKRRRSVPFDVIPTALDGVSLRAEAGKNPQFVRRALGRFALLGAEFAERKNKITRLSLQQEQPDREIKQLAQTHDGLRGIQSEIDGYSLNVIPRDTITWNPEVLKESLGLAYTSLVHEDLSVTISIAHGYATKEGPLTSDLLQAALITGLVSLGLPAEQLSMIVDPQVVATVNETKLADMLAAGKVTLLEGAGDVTESWAITVDPYKTT